VLDEVLGAGERFSVALTDLSTRHDIRPLVLRTALTYLELLGVLRQGTPFYATYEVRLAVPLDQVLEKFQGERARFLADLFAASKQGRTWYTVHPDGVAEALSQDRARVARALGYLEEQGWAELRLSDARQSFTRLDPAADPAALASKLERRFARREAQEVARVAQVLDLVTHAGCQTNFLVGYFGERRPSPCGHCTVCETGQSQQLPPPAPLPPLAEALDWSAVRALQAAHPRALGEPRQAARFLCGLSSPALTHARLTRHPLFGSLEARRFAEVLAACEAHAGD
jgi:ATP-dependent DNA helicase RecQ